MPSAPAQTAWTSLLGPDLLTRAASVLADELSRLPAYLQRGETERGPVAAQSRVPLVQCAAPVKPGSAGRATLRVSNEDSTPAQVTLYATNFVADSGYDLPAHRMSVTPRTAKIAGHADAVFEIAVAVPEQTPAGTYSALIQAMGSRYVKAVLTLDVL